VKILILGGTGFLGPELVRASQERGHVPTLFNRGKTRPELFPDVEKLRGDRDGGLDALSGRTWDAVFDTSGYVPRIVSASATLLAGAVHQYVFVSSISVYPDFSKPGLKEDAPVATTADPRDENYRGESYGALKALSERAAEAALPGRTTVVRPGLIVGPGDPTDRFTYWPARVARGGEVLAPGGREVPVQFIDVRDLARFMVRLVEDGHAGVYNAVGPGARVTMEELLHGCKIVLGSDARFTWVPDAFLAEQQVGAWMELPLWLPAPEGEGVGSVSNARAVAHGLAFRPAGDTIRDTQAWSAARAEPAFKVQLSADKERKVLAAWHARPKEPPPGAAKPAKADPKKD
jgi:2'-hydroxyisoflavone reductase